FFIRCSTARRAERGPRPGSRASAWVSASISCDAIVGRYGERGEASNFLPIVPMGRGTGNFGGGGVEGEAEDITPPPRCTGSPSPVAAWGGKLALSPFPR